MLKSILLPIDGSQYSKLAAQLAWRLALRTSAQVNVQHVVDLENAWRLFGSDTAGFASAADYNKAYAVTCKALLSLGGKIVSAYEDAVRDVDIEQAILLDQGNPFEQISRRARANDLVVIGHRRRLTVEERSGNFVRISLAEMLAHSCPRPLLVVQDKIESWQTMTIMISSEHINEMFISDSLSLAKDLGLQAAIVCLVATGEMIGDPASFAADLRSANPGLNEVPIEIISMDVLSIDKYGCWHAEEDPHPLGDWLTSLVVMPTRSLAGTRMTVLGISPVQFVRNLALPSLLLYPEESSQSEEQLVSLLNECLIPTV